MNVRMTGQILTLDLNAVSRAEAGQQKTFLLLNYQYKVIEEIPIDLGPRHYDVQLLPENLETSEDNALDSNAPSPLDDATDTIPELKSMLPSELRWGDRLRLTLSPDHIKHHKKTLNKLAAQGVAVEILAIPQKAAAPRITSAEDLGPQDLFQKYAEMRGMNHTSIHKGSEILSHVVAARGPAPGAAPLRQVSLSFSAVEVEGYFSFIEPVRYDLDERGLVVVTGKIENSIISGGGEVSRAADGGAESNGAGKTALVMAPLWGLTGDVDARSELGGGRGLTNGDVVNEDSKFARVKVEGSVDGVPFMVERKVVRRGRGGGLRFELDGEDRTMQDIRLTQAEIDGTLGTALLGRAAFYGQSEITALLESSDRAFKEELGKIVDLEVWGEAKEASKKALAGAKSVAGSVFTEVEVKQRYVAQQEAQMQDLEAQREAAVTALETKKATGRARLKESLHVVRAARADLAAAVSQATLWLTEAAASGQTTRSEERVQKNDLVTNVSTITRSGSEEESSRKLIELEFMLAEARDILAQAQLNQGAAQASANSKRLQLEDYLALDEEIRNPAKVDREMELRTAMDAFDDEIPPHIHHNHNHDDSTNGVAYQKDEYGVGGMVCDRCLQPLSPDQVAATAALLAEEHEEAAVFAAQAEEETAAASCRVRDISRQLGKARERQYEAMQAATTAKVEAARMISGVENRIKESNTIVGTADVILQDSIAVLESLGDTDYTERTANEAAAAVGRLADNDGSMAAGEQLLQNLRRSMQACSGQFRTIEAALDDLKYAENEHSPLDAEIQRRREWLATEIESIAQLTEHSNALTAQVEDLKAVDEAFRPTGIVSFVLEGALGSLQQSANHNLTQLAPGIALELAASRPRASSAEAVIEQVEKKVLVSVPGSSEMRQRSVKQLSGGERRRVALALALGFTELAARRGRLRCDLLVLDEVTQHLDGEGCARLAALLRGLDQFGTVLVVAQARSFMTRAFDGVDVVVKGSSGQGSIVLRDNTNA